MIPISERQIGEKFCSDILFLITIPTTCLFDLSLLLCFQLSYAFME